MRSVAAVVALVACLHAGAWALWQGRASAPNFDGVLDSVSYSPFLALPDDPASRPTEAQIRADLKTIAPYTRAIRLYKSTGGVEMVPAIANEFDLKVTLGISLNYKQEKPIIPETREQARKRHDEERKRNDELNEREVATAIDLARKNRNVNGIIVGNETILRGVYLDAEEREKWI